jgi:endonuclease-3 related protein
VSPFEKALGGSWKKGDRFGICDGPIVPSGPLLMDVFGRLLERFGPQHWWPGDSPLEIMVGAVLTQNTAWPNVEKAIRALKEKGDLSLGFLLSLPQETMAELIRPCGYFRIKARRLKNLLALAQEKGKGDLEAFLSLPTDELRKALLSVSGIGPETADSILLYAAKRPVFVVDAYTRRILWRHGWISREAKYEEIQALFMERIPQDSSLYNEYHALLVALGKRHCRPKPKCLGCPLEDLLPHEL